MSKQIYSILETLLLLLIISTSAIASESVITGKVVDNFDTPVEGVKIEIENTSLESHTNKNGEYKIEFVPGQFRVIYSKDGYKQNVLELNISKEARFPAKKMVLFKNPDSDGVFLLGKTNYQKIEPCKLHKKEGGNFRELVEYSVSGIPTYIAPQDTFRFLYYFPQEKIVGLYKLEQGIIRGSKMGISEKAINFEKWQKVDGVGGIGEIRLKEGEYAFSESFTVFVGGGLGEPTYCFYVSNKKDLPSWWALSERTAEVPHSDKAEASSSKPTVVDKGEDLLKTSQNRVYRFKEKGIISTEPKVFSSGKAIYAETGTYAEKIGEEDGGAWTKLRFSSGQEGWTRFSSIELIKKTDAELAEETKLKDANVKKVIVKKRGSMRIKAAITSDENEKDVAAGTIGEYLGAENGFFGAKNYWIKVRLPNGKEGYFSKDDVEIQEPK